MPTLAETHDLLPHAGKRFGALVKDLPKALNSGDVGRPRMLLTRLLGGGAVLSPEHQSQPLWSPYLLAAIPRSQKSIKSIGNTLPTFTRQGSQVQSLYCPPPPKP
jgi:hypothetical protein